MTDFYEVNVHVDGATIELVHLTKNKTKTIKWTDIMQFPFNYHFSHSKIIRIDDNDFNNNIIMETATALKDNATIYLSEMLEGRFGRKWTVKNIELETSLSPVQASKQTVDWCINKLTIPQLLEMGITYIRG